jgi:excisionase family DNA binding protein
MPPACYTVKEVCERLRVKRGSFYQLLAAGQLPMCEELKPRIGRSMRFRADLVERYLAGQFGQPRSFSSHRKAR